VCRIGFSDGAIPYVLPFSFGFDGASLYIHSARKGRKVDILQRNNRVCVEFEEDIALTQGDTACNYGFRYLTVICDGTAQLLETPAEKGAALNVIMQQYKPDWQHQNFSEQDLMPVLVYRIVIDSMTGKASGQHQ
jgi:nitroimidazol reductase NimA-like FMN-containing flavoprotein (pyridoxamine 5'-phosphate oxidase superfamily)